MLPRGGGPVQASKPNERRVVPEESGESYEELRAAPKELGDARCDVGGGFVT